MGRNRKMCAGPEHPTDGERMDLAGCRCPICNEATVYYLDDEFYCSTCRDGDKDRKLRKPKF